MFNALHIQQGLLCWTLKKMMYNNKNKDINFSTHNELSSQLIIIILDSQII